MTTQFGQVREEGGKPHYIRQDLDMMSVACLRERVGRISNQQARHLAIGIWQQVQGCYRGLDRGQLADRRSVAQALGWRPGQLVGLLERMQRASFGQVVLEGPEGMNEYLEGLHPMLRLFMPASQLTRSFDTAARMTRFLEFYVEGSQPVPHSFYNALKLMGGIVLALGLVALAAWYLKPIHSPPPLLIAGLAVPPILLLLCSMREYTAFFRRRALALYISFTDEFMDDEKQHDERLPRGPGW